MGNIYAIASYTNPLHPDVFPGICKMEAEVVRMACNLFHGDSETCGTVSSSFIIFLIFQLYKLDTSIIKFFLQILLNTSDDYRWYRINFISL